jgi:hypothetical protein
MSIRLPASALQFTLPYGPMWPMLAIMIRRQP